MKLTDSDINVFFDEDMAEEATMGKITIVTPSVASLSIGTTKSRVANGGFVYRIGDNIYSKVAVPAGNVASGAHIITANKWGVILYLIDSSGVITTQVPLATQAYDTSALAMAAGDAMTIPSNLCYIGRVLVQASVSDYTANTTDLDATASTTYLDADLSVTEMSPYTFYVIFDGPEQIRDIQSGSVITASPRILCKSSDVTGAKQGDEVTVNSKTYKITSILTDGVGFTAIDLSEDYYEET